MFAPPRVCVLASATAYFAGVLLAALTGAPRALEVSVLFVVAAAWAYGARAGAAAVVLEEAVELSLYFAGALPLEGVPLIALVPIELTDAVVVAVAAALRRARLRRAEAAEALRAKNAELGAALAEVRELRGMLPICAWCKCIRDVDGMWNQLEAYLAKHSRATFTHGICPTCVGRVTAEAQEPPSTECAPPAGGR